MESFEKALYHSVVDTLENMVFAEVSPVNESNDSPVAGPFMTVSLLIHDPIQCEMRLTMSHKLVAQITETVYSMPMETLSEQMLSDNFAEIINIIAGRFMAALLPAGEMFQLGLPELNPAEEIDTSLPNRTWKYQIDSDEFTITLIGEKLLSS